MAKQLNQEMRVNLTFGANTSQAKNQIIELQGLLNKIAVGTNINVNPAQMKEASAAAKELSMHLNNAYNATTGNFDLSKLNRSLISTKTNITELSSKLLSVGSVGQQAFISLAQSIAAADRPMVTINSRLTELWTTMKNTARWQLSSSMLHGFIGAVSSAYGYAQDLNESLNNIRIVTGQNVDQMSRFAVEANKAAKALSTTTTKYADAALIYYQQGLNDEQVKERTDATIKMANVSRQNAETVSEQLTAIWNNFDNGTKSLEYYVDVVTALGAATASSSEEIATGLEKFAAIAETVGLSYEYATAALATVTATTRQSADVVGTAFKTLFARIQDLELGETLEDGVNLGKYSEALNTIGVSILDANNNVKDMNDILDEMGAKWDTISKAQQVSLAQTVAGTRQYTQLIALMDNWDFFQQNLGVAEGSEGTLQEQADIYAESWEAARTRVKASAQDIYDTILDDKFFIDISNGFAKMLNGVDAFIDGLGGVKPLIFGISSMLMGAFSGRIVESLNNFKNNLFITFQGAQKQAQALTNEMTKVSAQILQKDQKTDFYSDDKLTSAMQVQLQGTQELTLAKNKLMLVSKNLSESEKQGAEITMNIISQYQQEAESIAQVITKLEERISIAHQGSSYLTTDTTTGLISKYGDGTQMQEVLYALDTAYDQLVTKIREASAAQEGMFNVGSFTRLSEEIQKLTGVIPTDNLREWANDLSSQLKPLGALSKELNIAIDELFRANDDDSARQALNRITVELNKVSDAEKNTTEAANGMSRANKNANEYFKEILGSLGQLNSKYKELKIAQDRVNKSVESFNPVHVVTGLERIVMTASGLGQVAMAINSTRSAINALNNEDMSFGEKLTTMLMSISMLVPAIQGTYKNLISPVIASISSVLMNAQISAAAYSTAVGVATLSLQNLSNVTAKTAMIQRLYNQENKDYIAYAIARMAVDEGVILAEDRETIAIWLAKVAQEAKSAEDLEAIIAEKLKTAAINKATLGIEANTSALWGNFAALSAVYGPILLVISGLAALALVLIKVNKLHNEDANAAEEAKKSVEKFTEATNNAKNAVEELKSSLSNYNTAIEGLKQAKKSMEDLEDATKKVNEETFAVLKQYENLAKIEGILDRDKDTGAYILNQDVVDSYIASMEQGVKIIEAATLISEGRSNFLTAKANTTELLRNERFSGQVSRGEESIGGLNAKGITLYAKDFMEVMQEEILNGPYEDAVIAYAEKIGLLDHYMDSYVEHMKDYEDEIKKLVKETEAAAVQMANVAKVLAGETLGSSATDNQLLLYGNTFSAVSEVSRNKWEEQFKNANLTSTTEASNEILQAYEDELQNLGLDFFFSNKNTVMGTPGNLTYTVNLNGEQQEMTEDDLMTLISSASGQFRAEELIRNSLQTYLDNIQSERDKVQLAADVDTSVMNSLVERLSLVNNSPEVAKQLFEILKGKSGSEQEDLINQFLATQPEEFDYKANLKEEAEKYDLEEEYLEYHAEHLMEYAGQVKEISADLKDNAKMVQAVTVANARMNKGLLNLAENFENYRYTLDNSEKGSIEYVSALKDISDAMNDVLGLDDVELSNTFLESTENLDLMSQAATGNVEAIEKLRAAAAQDIITNIEIDNEVAERSLEIFSRIMQNRLDSLDLTIGASFDDSDTLNTFNALAKNAKMTTEQIQDYFNALGYTPEIEYTTEQQEVTYKGHIPHVIEEENGLTVKPIPYEYTVTEDVQIPNIKSLTYHGSARATVNTRAISKANSGSTRKPSDTKLTKKSDVVDRYKEIDDSLDDLNDTLDDLNKKTDRAFGANRLKFLKEEKDLLWDQVELLQQKATEANKYYIDDKQALVNNKYGIQFNFDENGNITNYTDQMNKLYDDLHVKELELQSIKSSEEADAFEEAQVKPIQDKIEELKSLISQYDESKELLEDLQNQIDDAYYAWQDKNYEELTYKLELQIEINDDELKKLEFLIRRYENNPYFMAERAAELSNKLNPTKNNLALNAGMLGAKNVDGSWDISGGSLYQAYTTVDEETGKTLISQDKYVEGLRNSRDAIYSNLESLIEYDAAMKTLYSDTLQMAQDEISKYTDQMENLSGVLDHYINIMDLLGRETDYEAMENFYEGQKNLSRDSLEVSKSNYNMLLEQRKTLDDQLSAARKRGNEEEIKLLEDQMYDLDQTISQAYDKMLSDTEAWIESSRKVIENNMKKISKALEDGLTNNLGFDTLMEEFDRLNLRQEEYFTDTNKIYETNKMMRDIDKQIDNTSNKASKQRLANFKSEVQGLQDKNQLSKFELEIQQAKYDLLLAQIALEEAQNAKSTVRLSRDSEGNFGYVYTADQDKIDDAMQNVEDKENALYNKSLEGQQEYTEKYLQAQQQMNGELAELWQQYFVDQTISKEEYEAGVARVQEHYYGPNGILTTYSKQYNIAVQADSKATADFWAKDYGSMTQKTEEWKNYVNKYIGDVSKQTKEWESVSTQANEDVGKALDNSAESTKKLTEASDNLVTKITGENGVIDAMSDEITKVGEVTAAYGLQRDAVQGLIDDYILLIQKADEALKAQAQLEQDTVPPPKTPSPGNTGDGSTGDESDMANTGSSGASSYNNQGYSNADVIRAQKFVGTEADGKWGNNSINAAKAKGYDGLVSVMNALNSIGNAALFTSSFNGYIYSNPNYQSGKSQPDGYGGVVYEGAIKVPSGSGGFIIKDLYNDKVLIANEQGLEGWINKKALSGFKTGGYTGEWGPEGKLAFLHQKELVLNEDDTDNLLKTISFIRELVSMIDIQAAGASLFAMSAVGAHPIGGQKLEQQVSIQAEFPNVTDRYEIEEAFNSLVNRASQYANRKF